MDIYSAPLQRFAKSLGKKPYCTDDFDYGLRIRSKRNALRYSHISLNQRLRKYIVMDIDREAGALAYEEIGLEPTIIMTNPINTHAHLLYELKAPVSFSEKARISPQNFYLAVKRGMTIAMGADEAYAGLITKNPLSTKWRMTHCDIQYDLREIAEYCEPVSPYAAVEKDAIIEGRNCFLFNEVRLWAYAQVKDYVVYEIWSREVLRQCEKANIFLSPLPYSEIKAIAKSISKWVWENRYSLGSLKNRGAAEVDKTLSIQERQQIGAEYSNQLRKAKSERIILEAVSLLQQQDQKIGATTISKAAGVSRRTANNYRHLWKV